MNQILGFNVAMQMEAEKSPLNFIAGTATGLAIDIVLDNADWNPFFSKGVKQHGIYFDAFDCVSHSAVRKVEALMNYKKRNGLISEENLTWLAEKGYLDEEGNINCSERYIAKLSGTTKKGNSAWAVWDAINNFGLIPDKLWNFPTEQRTPVFDWDDFYQPIPQFLIDLGLEFLRRFEIKYEIILAQSDEMKKRLKYGPIQVFGYAWPAPVNGIYPRVEGQFGHAFNISKQEWDAQDSYVDSVDGDFIKRLAPDYSFYMSGYQCQFLEKKPEYLPINNKYKNMLIQKRGEAMLYVSAGNVLLPLRVNPTNYKTDLGGLPVKILSASEFAKFKIATKLKIADK